MFFTGNTFTYNDKSSELYGLFFANVTVSTPTRLSGNVEYKTMKLKRGYQWHKQDAEYVAPIEFDVEMITERLISQNKLHDINSWLFNQFDYKKLYVHDKGYFYDNIYFNCYFTDVEKIEYSLNNQGYGIYGFKAKMICDAPWAWENEQTKTYSNLDYINGDTIIFNNTSDCNDYMYPIIQAKKDYQGGTLTIRNVTDGNRKTEITTVSPNEVITFYHNPKIITPDNSNLFTNFNKNWPRLLPGENEITTSNIVELKITYKNARVV